MRDNWIDFWQKESMYCSQVNLTADTHGIILDWHKQSLKQFIDGLVERKESLLERCTECENREIHENNPVNKIHFCDISHLKEIRKQLE